MGKKRIKVHLHAYILFSQETFSYFTVGERLTVGMNEELEDKGVFVPELCLIYPQLKLVRTIFCLIKVVRNAYYSENSGAQIRHSKLMEQRCFREVGGKNPIN